MRAFIGLTIVTCILCGAGSAVLGNDVPQIFDRRERNHRIDHSSGERSDVYSLPIATTVTVDLEAQPAALLIEGSNFGDHPTVLFGTEGGHLEELTIFMSTDTFIEAILTRTEPGTYLLVVSTSYPPANEPRGDAEPTPAQGTDPLSHKGMFAMGITIGAEGPAGPAGPEGLRGQAGPPGPRGDPGAATARWNQIFDDPDRFVVLSGFNEEAVLDEETGLVWQRSPSTQPPSSWFRTNFFAAIRRCYNATTGGRMGWRLPTAEELSSLLVETPTANPAVLRGALPPGNPFLNIDAERHWSISEGSFDATPGRYVVAPNEPEVTTIGLETDLQAIHPTWCVRGPGGGQSSREH